MGAGHGHGHSDGRGGVETASGRHRTRLMISFAMVATFFVVELLAGIVTGSLALVSDAGHMAADVVTFGDMPNDVPMLGWAGLGVAMGNAHPDAVAAADEVTATNSEHGVARVLERFWR